MVELVLMAQGVAVVVVIALRWVLCADVTLSLPQAASELYWGGLLYLSKGRYVPPLATNNTTTAF